MSWKSFFGKRDQDKKKRNKQRAVDFGITDKELEDINIKFTQYAKEKSGKLTGNELRSMMKTMGYALSEQDLQQIVSDASGSYEFEQCVPVIVSKMKQKEAEMRDAFRTFDQNGDGVISISELRQALAKAGQKLSDSEIQTIVCDLDKDGDGFVNYEEFTKFVGGKQ